MRTILTASYAPAHREVSAGGLIIDFTHRDLPAAIIARINRSGHLEWCLPKGHVEEPETLEEAARREIEEETGIRGEIIHSLGNIEYWFTSSGQRIHKKVHHYLLQATGGEITTDNDPDHEAVDAAWVPFTNLTGRLSFANERRIAEFAREFIQTKLKL